MAIVKLPRADNTTALEQPSEDVVDLSTEEIRIDETGEYVDIEEGPAKAFGSSLLASLPSTILPALGICLVLITFLETPFPPSRHRRLPESAKCLHHPVPCLNN